MSSATVTRDLIVAQTRALKMPGSRACLKAWPAKRAMRIGRTRSISMRC
jgi:hypothetical protein